VKLDLILLHLFAASISLFGGGLMWWHRAQWVRHQRDPAVEPGERLFLNSQYRRRMQTSAMMATLGVLLHGSNEFLIPWQKLSSQFYFYFYVMLMLMLIGWMVLLALADWIATRAIHQAAMARLKEHQRQLEHSVGQLRNFKNQ